MGARLKDLGLGVVAAGWLVAATWMTPAGDVLAAPSGALFAGVVRMLVGGLG